MQKTIVIVTFILIGMMTVRAQSSYQLISATALSKLNLSQIQLVDVRTPQEYAEGHIASARQVDWYSPDFMKKITSLKLNKQQPVYLYCRSGFRSGEAAKALKQAGYQQVYSLDGGMNAWAMAKKPIQP